MFGNEIPKHMLAKRKNLLLLAKKIIMEKLSTNPKLSMLNSPILLCLLLIEWAFHQWKACSVRAMAVPPPQKTGDQAYSPLNYPNSTVGELAQEVGCGQEGGGSRQELAAKWHVGGGQGQLSVATMSPISYVPCPALSHLLGYTPSTN